MVVKERSFWSTTSGVVTGVAGTLTGVVGIATVAVQLGWIGSADDGRQSAAEETDAAGVTSSTPPAGASESSTTGADGRSSGGDERAARSATTTKPSFTVDPSAVSFQALGERTATVVLRNSSTVELNVDSITVEGEDGGQFAVVGSACTRASVAPGRSCEVEVSFTPTGNGTSRATMVIETEDASAQEVALSGSSLL